MKYSYILASSLASSASAQVVSSFLGQSADLSFIWESTATGESQPSAFSNNGIQTIYVTATNQQQVTVYPTTNEQGQTVTVTASNGNVVTATASGQVPEASGSLSATGAPESNSASGLALLDVSGAAPATTVIETTVNGNVETVTGLVFSTTNAEGSVIDVTGYLATATNSEGNVVTVTAKEIPNASGEAPAVTGSAAPSVTGSAAESATGSAAPSVTGSAAESATGSAAPSVTGSAAESATGSASGLALLDVSGAAPSTTVIETTVNGNVETVTGLVFSTTNAEGSVIDVTGYLATATNSEGNVVTVTAKEIPNASGEAPAVTGSAVPSVTGSAAESATGSASGLALLDVSGAAPSTTVIETTVNGNVETVTGLVFSTTNAEGSVIDVTGYLATATNSEGNVVTVTAKEIPDATGAAPSGSKSAELLDVTGVTPSTTVIQTTDAEGHTETVTGLVFTTTNAEGSIIDVTGYLATTTNSEGNVVTVTAKEIPDVTGSGSNSNALLDVTGVTPATTVFETTDAEGHTETVTGLVFSTTNAEGSIIDVTGYLATTTNSEGNVVTVTAKDIPDVTGSGSKSAELLDVTGVSPSTTIFETTVNGNVETVTGLVFSTTNSAGSIVDVTGYLATTTNSDGNVVTVTAKDIPDVTGSGDHFPKTTSLETVVGASRTIDATAVVYTTEENGSVQTVTGILVVSTGSDGKASTATVTSIPNDFGVRTTTFATTDSNGKTVTVTGAVYGERVSGKDVTVTAYVVPTTSNGQNAVVTQLTVPNGAVAPSAFLFSPIALLAALFFLF